MRQPFLLLVAIVIAVWCGMRFASDEPRADLVRAQEASTKEAGSRKTSRRDKYTVPDVEETAVLIQFVKTLKELRPATERAIEEYNDKAPAAVRRACERIIELDRDPKSAANRFARRELLLHRAADLTEADSVDLESSQAFAGDALSFLKDSDRTRDDVELAVVLATSFEEFASVEDAVSLYKSLGQLFIDQAEAKIARRGQYLLGAARRLGIVGQPFELTGTTYDGNSFDIASLKGKVVLVDFWASWCGHCLEEMPRLKRDYLAYRERGFEIVGVSVDDNRNELAKCLKQLRLPWITMHDKEAGSEHPAAIHYGIAGYPTTFLLDRDGNVIASDIRARKLGQKLKELLGAPAAKAADYPVFDIDDVLDHLSTMGTELHRAGKTRGDAELRKNLDRQTCELSLPPVATDVITERELYRNACESIFVVCSLYKKQGSSVWETSLATAFAVTSDGVLSTSSHVFDNEDNADAVIVMDVNRNVYPVLELLAVNKQSDTCLFRIDAKELRPLPLAEDAPPGTPVRVIGHPGDSFYFLSTGHVANYERDVDGTLWMNVTADFGQGSSGGPAFDDKGNVIGQVSRTFTLYAGGPQTRGRPRRVAGELKEVPKKGHPHPEHKSAEESMDPQMVFKSCVPAQSLRSLIKAAAESKSD